MADRDDHLNPGRALFSLRLIWAAMLLEQLILLLLIVFLVMPTHKGPADPQMVHVAHYVVVGLMGVALFAAHIVRSQIYKRHWEGSAVSMRGYASGNLTYYAIWNGVSLLGLVVVFLAGSFWPYILPTAVAAAVMIINWPDGKPMQPHDPPFVR